MFCFLSAVKYFWLLLWDTCYLPEGSDIKASRLVRPLGQNVGLCLESFASASLSQLYPHSWLTAFIGFSPNFAVCIASISDINDIILVSHLIAFINVISFDQDTGSRLACSWWFYRYGTETSDMRSLKRPLDSYVTYLQNICIVCLHRLASVCWSTGDTDQEIRCWSI